VDVLDHFSALFGLEHDFDVGVTFGWFLEALSVRCQVWVGVEKEFLSVDVIRRNFYVLKILVVDTWHCV
jgi:hypothetical protein